jgi:hypothetical protein
MGRPRKNKVVVADSTEVTPKQEKKKNLFEMQVDGVFNKHGVKSLDELLGTRQEKYSTRDIEEYEFKLNEMNTSDLHTHATQVGVLPNQDRAVLVRRLLREFRISNSEYLNTYEKASSFGNGKEITEEVRRILGEGR